LGHKGPDEFDVIPLAPLSLPKDFEKTPATEAAAIAATKVPPETKTEEEAGTNAGFIGNQSAQFENISISNGEGRGPADKKTILLDNISTIAPESFAATDILMGADSSDSEAASNDGQKSVPLIKEKGREQGAAKMPLPTKNKSTDIELAPHEEGRSSLKKSSAAPKPQLFGQSQIGPNAPLATADGREFLSLIGTKVIVKRKEEIRAAEETETSQHRNAFHNSESCNNHDSSNEDKDKSTGQLPKINVIADSNTLGSAAGKQPAPRIRMHKRKSIKRKHTPAKKRTKQRRPSTKGRLQSGPQISRLNKRNIRKQIIKKPRKHKVKKRVLRITRLY
jgi:hypothetical protein